MVLKNLANINIFKGN